MRLLSLLLLAKAEKKTFVELAVAASNRNPAFRLITRKIMSSNRNPAFRLITRKIMSMASSIDLVEDLLAKNPQQKCDLGNGETLTYTIFPAAKEEKHTLVFVPGLTFDAEHSAWLSVRPEFDDHRIIAINPRGYGGSTNNKSIFSHEENAEDVKLLLDKIGIRRTMAMGYSTGGGTVTNLALKYPERITAAFLKSSIPLNGWYYNLTPDGERTNEPVTTRRGAKQLEETFSKMTGLSPEPNFDKYHERFSMLMVPGKSPPRDGLIWKRRYEGAVAHKSRFEAIVSNLWFNVTPVQTPRSPPSLALEGLKVPLIVIHGINDITVSQKQARAITELAEACNWAPPGMISYYEHSGGHYPIFECPDELFPLYRKALEEQALKAAPGS